MKIIFILVFLVVCFKVSANGEYPSTFIDWKELYNSAEKMDPKSLPLGLFHHYGSSSSFPLINSDMYVYEDGPFKRVSLGEYLCSYNAKKDCVEGKTAQEYKDSILRSTYAVPVFIFSDESSLIYDRGSLRFLLVNFRMKEHLLVIRKQFYQDTQISGEESYMLIDLKKDKLPL